MNNMYIIRIVVTIRYFVFKVSVAPAATVDPRVPGVCLACPGHPADPAVRDRRARRENPETTGDREDL